MTRITSKVSPHHSTRADADAPRPSSRSSLAKSSPLSPLRKRLTLNVEKFDKVLSPSFTSGFEESEDCFGEVTHKAASLLGAEKCFLVSGDQPSDFLASSPTDKVLTVPLPQ